MTVGPTARARRNKLAARRRRAKSIYQQVDDRDGQICRACGVFCGHRRHQHHIVYRSLGGLETTGNLVTLCQWHHEQVHGRVLTIVGSDADSDLRFEPVAVREMEP